MGIYAAILTFLWDKMTDIIAKKDSKKAMYLHYLIYSKEK
jgi:hypothetical protein